jgi:hypothetical protein
VLQRGAMFNNRFVGFVSRGWEHFSVWPFFFWETTLGWLASAQEPGEVEMGCLG